MTKWILFQDWKFCLTDKTQSTSKQQELSFSVSAMQNGKALWEDTIWLSNHIPTYKPRWFENLHPDKNVHVNAYISSMLNHHKLEDVPQ